MEAASALGEREGEGLCLGLQFCNALFKCCDLPLMDIVVVSCIPLEPSDLVQSFVELCLETDTVATNQQPTPRFQKIPFLPLACRLYH